MAGQSVLGRNVHFLSGPDVKKGQIQSDINHCAAFPTAIVIEQNSGKRPTAGGNKKPFYNCGLGCQHAENTFEHVNAYKRPRGGIRRLFLICSVRFISCCDWSQHRQRNEDSQILVRQRLQETEGRFHPP